MAQLFHQALNVFFFLDEGEEVSHHGPELRVIRHPNLRIRETADDVGENVVNSVALVMITIG